MNSGPIKPQDEPARPASSAPCGFQYLPDGIFWFGVERKIAWLFTNPSETKPDTNVSDLSDRSSAWEVSDNALAEPEMYDAFLILRNPAISFRPDLITAESGGHLHACSMPRESTPGFWDVGVVA